MKVSFLIGTYEIDVHVLYNKDFTNGYSDSLIFHLLLNNNFQIALVDMLTRLGIKPDGMIGHSVGELCCAYADGCLTAEETIMSAYWRGRYIDTAELPTGGMAAVGESVKIYK